MRLGTQAVTGGSLCWKVVSGQVEYWGGELGALEAIFGWAVQGPTASFSFATSVTGRALAEKGSLISKQLQVFWELESIALTGGRQSGRKRCFEHLKLHRNIRKAEMK